MDRQVRRKLAMVERVLEFVRTHPSEGVSWTGVVSRLEELVKDAGVMAVAEEEGRQGARGATAQRRAVRDRMHREMVTHLVLTAQVAFKGDEKRVASFALPRASRPYRAYAVAARALHARALPLREELVAAGLGDTLLDDLAVALEELDVATAAVVVRRREHVDARLRLLAITDELMEQVRLLGGLLRPRYRREPALAELWENVRQVDGPARFGRNGVVGSIGPAPGNEMVVPPTSGEDVSGAGPVPTDAVKPVEGGPPAEDGRRDVS